MTAQEHTARSLSPHGRNCRSESLLVTFRTATLWWPVRSQLAEGEITPEDGHPRGAERICQYHEKRRVAVRSRAVRQDEAITAGTGRVVQEPSNGYFIRWSVHKFSIVVHTQGLLQPMAAFISPNTRMPVFRENTRSRTQGETVGRSACAAAKTPSSENYRLCLQNSIPNSTVAG